MPKNEEGVVVGLVHKYRRHLLQRALALVHGRRAVKGGAESGTLGGATVFYQVLEGYVLTLADSADAGHQLGILNWRFTNPALN